MRLPTPTAGTVPTARGWSLPERAPPRRRGRTNSSPGSRRLIVNARQLDTRPARVRERGTDPTRNLRRSGSPQCDITSRASFSSRPSQVTHYRGVTTVRRRSHSPRVKSGTTQGGPLRTPCVRKTHAQRQPQGYQTWALRRGLGRVFWFSCRPMTRKGEPKRVTHEAQGYVRIG